MVSVGTAQETVVLGAEHDTELRLTVLAVMRDLGAVEKDTSWAVAGSQELEQLATTFGNRTVRVEAETYIGLSITGDPILVSEIAGRVRQRLPRLSQ
jgi:hypothetical protein